MPSNSVGRAVRVGGSVDSASASCPIGSRVVRGPDWKWNNQGSNMEGTVISLVENG